MRRVSELGHVPSTHAELLRLVVLEGSVAKPLDDLGGV
jgi:hypothetical protein